MYLTIIRACVFHGEINLKARKQSSLKEIDNPHKSTDPTWRERTTHAQHHTFANSFRNTSVIAVEVRLTSTFNLT